MGTEAGTAAGTEAVTEAVTKAVTEAVAEAASANGATRPLACADRRVVITSSPGESAAVGRRSCSSGQCPRPIGRRALLRYVLWYGVWYLMCCEVTRERHRWITSSPRANSPRVLRWREPQNLRELQIGIDSRETLYHHKKDVGDI